MCCLPSGRGLLDRDELPGDEAKLLDAFDLEFEVLGLRRKQDGLGQLRIQQLAFDRGAFLRLSAHDVWYIDATGHKPDAEVDFTRLRLG